MKETNPQQAVGAPLERQVRPLFEAWARAQGHLDLTRSELRSEWYGNSYTNESWMAWQAAVAAARERCITEVFAWAHEAIDRKAGATFSAPAAAESIVKRL